MVLDGKKKKKAKCLSLQRLDRSKWILMGGKGLADRVITISNFI